MVLDVIQSIIFLLILFLLIGVVHVAQMILVELRILAMIQEAGLTPDQYAKYITLLKDELKSLKGKNDSRINRVRDVLDRGDKS